MEWKFFTTSSYTDISRRKTRNEDGGYEKLDFNIADKLQQHTSYIISSRTKYATFLILYELAFLEQLVPDYAKILTFLTRVD